MKTPAPTYFLLFPANLSKDKKLTKIEDTQPSHSQGKLPITLGHWEKTIGLVVLGYSFSLYLYVYISLYIYI